MLQNLISKWESSNDLSEFLKSVQSVGEEALSEFKNYLLAHFEDEEVVEGIVKRMPSN